MAPIPGNFWTESFGGRLLDGMTMEGVNAELWPLARMTALPKWRDRPILEWPTGQILFKSWVLLLGVLPIDRHVFLWRS